MISPVWAAICGTIRNEVDFSLMLDYLLRCRAEGEIQGIVFSTWQRELDNFPKFKEQLQRNGIQIVLSTPVEDLVKDMKSESVNYWRQTVQLQAALNVIPDDAVVIKTRTDRAIPVTRKLVAMLAEDDPLPDVSIVQKKLGLLAFPQEFTHQIAIFHARTGRAFQFTDFAFMGYSVDLRKLLNFDVSELYYSRGMVANMQFFVYPFIRDYPIIKDYYRRINFRFLINDNAAYIKAGGTDFPQFLERFNAVYFGILASHFRVGMMNSKAVGEITLPIEFTDFFHTSHKHQTVFNGLGTIINSSAFLDEFLTQSTATVKPTTQHVLDIVRTATTKTFERATNQELQELHQYANENRAFSNRHWLRRLPFISSSQEKTYKSPIKYRFPGISASEQADLWRTCQDTDWIGVVIFDFWLKHDIAPKDSAVYLMGSARDGDPFSLLILTRMLRRGEILDESTAKEALKLAQFNGRMIAHHDTGNIQAVCYILNYYLYMKANGMAVSKGMNFQVDYVFKRYMKTEKAQLFRKTMDSHDTKELHNLFDAEIMRLKRAGNKVIQRRLTEMALEITHDKAYWPQLVPLIEEQKIRQLYEYSNRNGLLTN
ncbi:hypothetical protein ACFQ44_09595 [Levilactobacillus lanxiensis]|uniref:Uncharacterized protein n=1 Tax=Levilactobacillus lanxiensis TaxID=2799568 RepID=A0ABW4D2W3_9LACO|nr:hypothetical protein [Levilactobacillus lanxiensis]